MFFCSPFPSAEFFVAASDLFSSIATKPDKVAYPVLKHLPRSGMDFLLYIFNLSWSLHSFPSICKTSSIIPIYKMGKPLDSPASFRPISVTSCVSKLFERIILSHLLFFLESNSILSPCQASFCPGRFTLDQSLYLSQSMSDRFNKPRQGSQTILSAIDFLKAFDSVWHPALFHKLILAGLSPCLLVGLNLSFLIGALVWSIKITKVVPFRVRRGVLQGCILGPVLFSLFISDLPGCLVSFVSCSLSLIIWPFGPPPPRSPLWWMPHKELCFDWSAGLSTGVFLSIRANVSPLSSQWIPTMLTSSPTSFYLAPAFVSIPLPTFLGVPFDCTLSFCKHVSLLMAKFFLRLKALRCISASTWGPS